MRNTLRLLGIIALAVIFGIGMGACDNGSTSNSVDNTPVASDYTVTGGGTQTYTGNPISVTITPKAGKSQGAVTVLYNGSSTPKSEIGAYEVTFNVAASGDWKAAEGLAGGILIISNSGNLPIPQASDYSVSGREQTYNGEAKRVNIVPIPGKSNGAVYHIRYNGLGEPTDVGTYDILFDVEGTDTYQSAKDLSGGQMVISNSSGVDKVTPVKEDFIIIGLGTYPYNSADDAARWVFVEAKPGKTGGTITVKYNGSTAQPREVGEYTVTFDVTESGPYSATTITAGPLVITAGKEIIRDFFDISGLSQEYDGFPKKVVITPRLDHQKLDGKVTIKYQPAGSVPTTSVPYQVGSYEVTFDVSGAEGYVATSEAIPAGTLVIGTSTGSATPPATGFKVEGLGTFAYNASLAKIVSVTAVDNDYSGQITVRYQRRSGGGYVEKPYDAGTYTVIYDVTPSVKYGAASIQAGELTIYQVNPNSLSDFVVTGGPFRYDGTAHEVTISSATLGAGAEYSILYDGYSSKPVNAGEYNVTFSVLPSDNWQAASNIEVATPMVVNKGNPKFQDYTIVQAVGQPYNGSALVNVARATPTAVGYEVSDGRPTFLYSGSTTPPVDAGVYEVMLRIPATDNWAVAEWAINGVEITARVPAVTDFIVTGLSQVAYSPVVAPVFARNPASNPAYPALARQPNVTYFNKVTGARVQNINNAGPGTYTVSITLGVVANWTNPTLSWTLEVTDLTFTNAIDFVKWLNGRPGNSVTAPYSVKFGSTSRLTNSADNGVPRIVRAITDDGAQTPTANDVIEGIKSVNNRSKYLRIDMGDAIDSTVTGSISFTNCSTIVELNLLNNETITLASGAFTGCTNLATLKLPTGDGTLAGLPGGLFSNCEKLTTLDMGGYTTIVANDLNLSGASSKVKLANITLNKVDFDGSTAFYDGIDGNTHVKNNDLKTVTITSDDVKLAADTFRDCIALTTVTFPQDETTGFGTNIIPARAFKGCSNLSSVVFPKVWEGFARVPDPSEPTDPPEEIGESIEELAFEDCKKLVDINIPYLSDDTTYIHPDAFKGIEIKSITLGNGDDAGTQTIGNVVLLYDNGDDISDIAVFKDLKSLETLTLKNGVVTLPLSAFQGCTKLKTVTFPEKNFTKIGTSAFEGCEALVSVDLRKVVGTTVADAIGAKAFKGCKALNSIAWPEGTSPAYTTINAGAFYNTGFRTLTLPNSVTTISGNTTGDGGAFQKCESLESVTYGNGAGITIQTLAFADCPLLKDFSTNPADAANRGKVVIEKTVTTLAANAFQNGKAISEVVINVPATTVTYVGQIFSGCSNLEKLKFTQLDSETLFATTAITFSNTTANSLPSVKVLTWDTKSGITDGTSSSPTIDFTGLTGLERLIVSKDQAAVIASGRFATVAKPVFTTLEINAAQTTVATGGQFANLPASVTNVIVGTPSSGTTGYEIKATTTASFRNTVNYVEFKGLIGDLGEFFLSGLGAFGTPPVRVTVVINSTPFQADGTTSNFNVTGYLIGTVKVGKDTPAFDSTAFTSAELKEFVIDPLNEKMGNYQADGVLYHKDGNGALNKLVQYPAKKAKVAYTVAPGVTEIGNTAFGGVGVGAEVTSLTIPASVTKIGTNAYVNLVNTATSSGDYPLVINYNAVSAKVETAPSTFPITLKYLNIGDGVRIIPGSFLGANTQLKVLKVPSSVTEIGNGAFSSATAITDVEFNAAGDYQGVDIFKVADPDDAKIERVTFGSGVKVVRSGMFYNQAKLVYVSLPDTVTSIEGDAFNTCKLLNRVAIPADVMSIGIGAFIGCEAMGELIFKGDATGFANTGVFMGAISPSSLRDLYLINGRGKYTIVAPPATGVWSRFSGDTSFE
jgi:hypothetical protein